MAITIREIAGSLDATTVVRYVYSLCLAENAGTSAPARVLLRDGALAGDVLVDIRLAAGESKEISFARPLYFPTGCYVQVSTGTVRGMIDGD